MFILTTVYRFLRGLVLFCLPILIILFSISTNLGNAQLHKNTLKNSNFYQDLSSEIKSVNASYDSKSTFLLILVQTSLNELATPGWLQFLSEKNIDLTTQWLNGDKQDWTFYLPTDEIDLALTKKIDSQVNLVNKEHGDKVEVCSDSVEASIKKEGYDLDKQFCLPKDVKKGNQSLTDFIGFNGISPSNKKILNSIVRKNTLNTYANNFNLNDNSIFDSNWVNIVSQIKTGRDNYVKLKKLIPIGIGIILGALILALILYRIQSQNVIRELRKILWISSTNTIFTSLAIVLIIGGSSYLTSSINKILLPGLTTSKIINLLTWELLKFSFNLVSLAILIAASMLILNLVLLVLEKILHENKAKNRNAAFVENSLKKNSVQNPTLDGQFKSVVEQKKLATYNMPSQDYNNFQTQNSGLVNFNTPMNKTTQQTQDYTNLDYPDELPSINPEISQQSLNNSPVQPVNPISTQKSNPVSKPDGKNITWF